MNAEYNAAVRKAVREFQGVCSLHRLEDCQHDNCKLELEQRSLDRQDFQEWKVEQQRVEDGDYR